MIISIIISSEYSLYDLANIAKIVEIPFPYDNWSQTIIANGNYVSRWTLLEENVDYEIIDDQAILVIHLKFFLMVII